MSTHSFKNIVLGSSTSQTSSNHQTGIECDHQTPEIPSTAAKISIKKKFLKQNNQEDEANLHFNKCLIKLDWASTENGSHILTIGLGNKIYVYSCVSQDMMGKGSSIVPSREKQFTTDDSLVKWLLFR